MIAQVWSALTAAHTARRAGPCEVLTWEDCPRCGGLAAVGREPTDTGTALDFDCTAGCEIAPAAVRGAFTPAGK